MPIFPFKKRRTSNRTAISPSPYETPMLAANRTSGIAPLAVHFDAVGSSTDIYQPPNGDFELPTYYWEFNDVNSGAWTYSGKRKNAMLGSQAVHVFETAGTYHVTLQMTDSSGNIRYYYQDITVTDPDVAYSGSTYYVANAPTGNNSNNGTSTSTPFETFAYAMSVMFASNGTRRVLFKRGESFAVSSVFTVNNKSGAFHIGAYGTGAKPRLVVADGGNSSATTFNFGSDVLNVRLVDLDMRRTSGSNAGVNLGAYSTMVRCEMDGWVGSQSAASGNGRENICFYDCIFNNYNQYGVYIAPTAGLGQPSNRHVDVIGCSFDNGVHGGSGAIALRTYASRSAYSSNYFGASDGESFRLLGLDDPIVTEYVCFTDNHINQSTPSSNVWQCEFGPENDNSPSKLVRHVLIEGNKWTRPTTGNLDGGIKAMLMGTDFVVRNNVINNKNATYQNGFWVVRRPGPGGASQPIPSNVRIYNNTCHTPTATLESGYLVHVGNEVVSPVVVKNNINYSSVTAAVIVQSGGGASSQGTNSITNPSFVNPGTGDFHLQSASNCINQGSETGTTRDYDRRVRPGGACDIGAFEA